MSEIIESFYITMKLATVTTCLLMFMGIPVAYWLATSKTYLRSLVGTAISMPLVLPPSVIGFYLLLAYSRVEVGVKKTIFTKSFKKKK